MGRKSNQKALLSVSSQTMYLRTFRSRLVHRCFLSFQLHQQRNRWFVSWRKRSSYLIKGLDEKDSSRVPNIVAH